MNINSANYYGSVGTVKQLNDLTLDLPEIAFSGRSNVGKSSLINKVLNRKSLARMSATPGKTITVNFFKLNDCYFVDLPGYGYAKRSASEQKRWSDLVEGYFTTGRNISLVVQLLDMRHPPSADDITMLEFLDNSEYEFIIVLTKCDKLNKTETEKNLQMFEEKLAFLKKEVTVIEFSSLKGTNCEDLRGLIESFIKK